MEINLNKKEEEYTYYYTEDGKQIGPLNLVQLISTINGETMVWREGIDWTNANKLESGSLTLCCWLEMFVQQKWFKNYLLLAKLI